MNCQQKVGFHPGTAAAREGAPAGGLMLAKDTESVISSAKRRAGAGRGRDEVIFIPVAAPAEAPCGANNVIYRWRGATT